MLTATKAQLSATGGRPSASAGAGRKREEAQRRGDDISTRARPLPICVTPHMCHMCCKSPTNSTGRQFFKQAPCRRSRWSRTALPVSSVPRLLMRSHPISGLHRCSSLPEPRNRIFFLGLLEPAAFFRALVCSLLVGSSKTFETLRLHQQIHSHRCA